MADRARHAFGDSQNLQNALNQGLIDSFDILFLDGDTNPKIGWQDKNNVTRIVDTDKVITVEGDALPETGEINKVYIFKDEGYFWNGTEFKPFAQSADLTALTTQVSNLEDTVATKVSAEDVDKAINEKMEEFAIEVVEF